MRYITKIVFVYMLAICSISFGVNEKTQKKDSTNRGSMERKGNFSVVLADKLEEIHKKMKEKHLVQDFQDLKTELINLLQESKKAVDNISMQEIERLQASIKSLEDQKEKKGISLQDSLALEHMLDKKYKQIAKIKLKQAKCLKKQVKRCLKRARY